MSGKERNKQPEPQAVSPPRHGIREKLIAIFIAIKVLPLIALALLAANQIGLLGDTVKQKSTEMVGDTRQLVSQIGKLAADSSIRALDDKSRETIERLTTDTAANVAAFLYERDGDILFAADLPPSPALYRRFLAEKKKAVVFHRPWKLSDDGGSWQPAETSDADGPAVRATVPDNEKSHHYRPPPAVGESRVLPLYHEMTFIDLNGRETIKASATELLPRELLDVSRRENTWCKAEDYFPQLAALRRGEVYVSRVIGPYLPSPIIGPYTPQAAKQRNIPFEPEKAGYGGKENPVGQRFQAVVRWVTPVYQGETRIGYVSLALDHTHLMEFTDHLMPTDERYSDISDPASGNYAFMWDFEGRNISHPRDYFIVGFNPETGEQEVPWLSAELYDTWLAAEKSFIRFEKAAPRFLAQSLEKQPASQLTEAGLVGLDCRYLNFAPQCVGWHDLTQHGGSGSFVIFWSNLWKLTTAAAIPYHTGMYKNNPRGFGFITIGANVDEFHSAATETAATISTITEEYQSNLEEKSGNVLALVDRILASTIGQLTFSTAVMVIIVIFIAILMASTLTGKLTTIIDGIRRFQAGDYSSRLAVVSRDELGQLTEALNAMSDDIEKSVEEIHRAKERAEESDKAKSLFLANMSHEIRTPMNAIIGMSRLACEASENEEQRKLLEAVRTSADSLLSVVNDILDFSKIEAGQLDLEQHPFSLGGLVQSTIKSVEIILAGKDISLGYAIAEGVPDHIRGDQMRLRQILVNLLGNAVKFTNRGIISLEVSGREEGDGRIRLQFSVRDTGIGIAPEHLEMIFDSFSQSDLSLSRKHQGAGLGLAISRKLCRLMGGDITVASRLGQGSTFSFSIVVDRCPGSGECGERPEQPRTGQAAPRRILLVEDNDTNRELARLVLEQAGHSLAAVESGLAALRLLGEEDFDIVLMDLQMPELDGFTTTRIIRDCERRNPGNWHIDQGMEARLRQRLAGRHQPIVILTAHAMRGDKEKCLAAGADDYLTKPFIPDQVAAVLDALTGPDEAPPSSGATEIGPKQHAPAGNGRRQLRASLAATFNLPADKIDELLQTAEKSVSKDLALLQAAMESGDCPRIRAVAHSLKGLLLNLTLQPAAELAASLQEAAEQGALAEVAPLHARLREALATVFAIG